MEFFQEDHNWIYFRGDRSICKDLKEKFSFHSKGYMFDQRYKMGFWDGKISVIDLKNLRFPAGIFPLVEEYLQEEKIPYNSDNIFDINYENYNDKDIIQLYKDIKGPLIPHDSQIDALKYCLFTTRNILLAPTSNGKSYIIHGLLAHHISRKRKALIIIDRSQLVMQLKENLVDEYKASYKVKTIYDKDESEDFEVFITTWQSIYKREPEWFKQFEVLIIDEIHKAKAKSITKMMERTCDHIQFRHGFTATLDNDCASDKTNLIGLFGSPKQIISLKDQIRKGISAEPKVFLINLKYSKLDENLLRDAIKTATRDCKEIGATAFRVEEEIIENHIQRNLQILNIVKLLKGNTLVAFKKDTHGRDIHKLISKKVDIPTFFINGTVEKKKRFEYQKEILGLENSIIVASLGVFSTGINIPNLNNLVIVTQVKSAITIPQLVGRMIRITEDKKTVNIIDFIDIIGKNNIYQQHSRSRIEFYLKNGFEIKEKTINLPPINV